MDDLVLLRELIRTPGSTCFPLSTNHVFANLWMEALLGCLITRASPPCNPIAVALPFSLLGIKSTNACVRAGRSVDSLTRKYTRGLNTPLRLDVGPEAFALFRGGMDRTYVLACQTSTSLSVPGRGRDAARSTRPISMIRRDIRTRRYGSIPEKLRKRKQKAITGTPNPLRKREQYASARLRRRNRQ